MTLPDALPLFPLPNVVLFPGMALPLHVFEPRYRAMVRDAARGARTIGMVLLRGNWRDDYHGRPTIFSVGTAGEMIRVAELPDGRFDIVLRGMREYVILGEADGAPYRTATVRWRDPVTGTLPGELREGLALLVRRYLTQRGHEGDPEVLRARVDDETFVNFLAQHLDVDAIAKQAVLEASTLVERARRLYDVLEFQVEEMRLHPVGAPERPQ